MGLDIYMFKVKKATKDVSANDLDLSNGEEVAYFRKVNSLYGYFQNQLDDEYMAFVNYNVVDDIIDKAKSIIQKAKETPNDWQEFAKDTLPTCSGFFFGSTEYDEWYLEGVQLIIDQLSSVLNDWDDDAIYYIYFSY